ncbi:MAG: hypothetical protein V4719_31360 [Planctomycetota bacterium]
MPDPVLYSQAMIVAAIVSALCVLIVSWAWPSTATANGNLAVTLAVGAGLLAGYRVLHLRCAWPPVNGLDRLLTIGFPAIFGIELVACWPRVPPWVTRSLRLLLAASLGRILLHGSVYLGGPRSTWTTADAFAVLALGSVILIVAWWLLHQLSFRSTGSSVLLALSLSCQTTAITIMLAGYVTGGAAAIPLTAALAGTAVASNLFRTPSALSGAMGIGVVGLFGLLFIGRFFGGISTLQALTIFLAPLLCGVTEVPQLRPRKPWQVALVRLGLVAIPLVIVLVGAKRTFDRETAPLLGTATIQSRTAGAQRVI